MRGGVSQIVETRPTGHAVSSYRQRLPAPIGSGPRQLHAGGVNRSRSVSLLLLFAALTAADAGRVGESGTGAMWIAPELLEAHATAQTCAQTASMTSRELVFEMLQPDDIDADLPRLLATASREVVDFEWNPATSELRFTTTAPTAVFSDLELSAQASVALPMNCGSR